MSNFLGGDSVFKEKSLRCLTPDERALLFNIVKGRSGLPERVAKILGKKWNEVRRYHAPLDIEGLLWSLPDTMEVKGVIINVADTLAKMLAPVYFAKELREKTGKEAVTIFRKYSELGIEVRPVAYFTLLERIEKDWDGVDGTWVLELLRQMEKQITIPADREWEFENRKEALRRRYTESI